MISYRIDEGMQEDTHHISDAVTHTAREFDF